MALFYSGNLYPLELSAGVALHLSVIPFVISGCLMVSKTIHIPKP